MNEKIRNLFWLAFRYYCRKTGITGDKEEKLLRRGLEEQYEFRVKDDYEQAFWALVTEAQAQAPAIDMTYYIKKMWEIKNEINKDRK